MILLFLSKERNDVNITLNGERKQVPDGMTIRGLLELLKIQPQRVAVELNLEIVKKDRYGMTDVKEGDSLEVVSFMAGGSLNAECGMRNLKNKNAKCKIDRVVKSNFTAEIAKSAELLS